MKLKHCAKFSGPQSWIWLYVVAVAVLAAANAAASHFFDE